MSLSIGSELIVDIGELSVSRVGVLIRGNELLLVVLFHIVGVHNLLLIIASVGALRSLLIFRELEDILLLVASIGGALAAGGIISEVHIVGALAIATALSGVGGVVGGLVRAVGGVVGAGIVHSAAVAAVSGVGAKTGDAVDG